MNCSNTAFFCEQSKLLQKQKIRTLHLKHCKHTNTHTEEKRKEATHNRQQLLDESGDTWAVTQLRHIKLPIFPAQTQNQWHWLHSNKHLHYNHWAATVSTAISELKPSPVKPQSGNHLHYNHCMTGISVSIAELQPSPWDPNTYKVWRNTNLTWQFKTCAKVWGKPFFQGTKQQFNNLF